MRRHPRTFRFAALGAVILAGCLVGVGAATRAQTDEIAPCPPEQTTAFPKPGETGVALRTLLTDAYVRDGVGARFVAAGTQVRDSPVVRVTPITYALATEDLHVWNFFGAQGYVQPQFVRAGEIYIDDMNTYTERANAPILAPVRDGMPAPPRVLRLAVKEDTIVTDITGVRLVRAGETILDAPAVKTRPAVYRVASCDITTSGPEGFRRVNAGERYLEDVTTYIEPILPYPTVVNTPVRAPARPTVTVGATSGSL